jgi:hypothetical protein
MKTVSKNIKISQKHHEILKSYCDKGGLKMYRVIEKWIDELSKTKKRDIYGES